MNILWLKVNDIAKRYVFIKVPSIQYVTWLVIEYVVSGCQWLSVVDSLLILNENVFFDSSVSK